MENTKGQKNKQDQSNNKNQESEHSRTGGERQNTASEKNNKSGRNEQKLSGGQRNATDRNTGLSSKTGVTGSDKDGQVSE